jgi:hypothetical protein
MDITGEYHIQRITAGFVQSKDLHFRKVLNLVDSNVIKKFFFIKNNIFSRKVIVVMVVIV